MGSPRGARAGSLQLAEANGALAPSAAAAAAACPCCKTGVLDEVSVGFDARRWLYVANSCFKLEKESRKKLGITPKTRGLKPLAGDAPPIFGHCHRSGTESRSVTALHKGLTCAQKGTPHKVSMVAGSSMRRH